MTADVKIFRPSHPAEHVTAAYLDATRHRHKAIVTLTIDATVLREFAQRCAAQGLPISRAVERLMDGYNEMSGEAGEAPFTA